jgi:hypothetical protein
MDGDTTAINTLTGMKLDRWAHWLEDTGLLAEDPDMCALLLDGIENGVNIDFVGDRSL